MTRLDICKSSFLPESVLKSLFSRKIFTVQQFLEENINKIIQITGLSYKDVVTLKHSLITNHSAFPRKGIDEYSDLLSNSILLQTEIKCFDKMMGIELMTGSIIEICGFSGSGKTQFCLTVCANVSLNKKKVVHFIDTSLGNFTAERIENMLESRKLSKEVVKSTMERIKITKVNNIYELLSVLHNLKTALGNEETCCRLIVIDSLSSVYLPLLNEENNDSLSFINHAASLMKFISKQFHLVFIVVNLATKLFDPEAVFENSEDTVIEPSTLSFKDFKPTLGKYWLHVPNTRILIRTDKTSDDTKCILTIVKSCSVPSNQSCIVSVRNQGIVSDS